MVLQCQDCDSGFPCFSKKGTMAKTVFCSRLWEQLKNDKQLDHLSAFKMLAALEGVLSPRTFNKTREGLTEAFKKNDDSS